MKTDYKKVERWSGREKYLSGLSVDVPKIISYDGRDIPEFRRCLTSLRVPELRKALGNFLKRSLASPQTPKMLTQEGVFSKPRGGAHRERNHEPGMPRASGNSERQIRGQWGEGCSLKEIPGPSDKSKGKAGQFSPVPYHGGASRNNTHMKEHPQHSFSKHIPNVFSSITSLWKRPRTKK